MLLSRLERTGRRPPKRRRALLVAAAALAVAWPLAAWGAASFLAAGADAGAGVGRADALVVLGGSATYVERTREAARLFREGRAPVVILTDDRRRGGWSSAEQRNPFFVERAAEELRREGVPAEALEVLPRAVASTYDEAVLARDEALARGWRSVVVVTSAYHSRRALWTFRRVFEGTGISVGIAAAETGRQTPPPHSWWLSAVGWRTVAGEYPKLVYYWLNYG
ncbi:MAG TPA: YdcF family protein [Pyrinomonadaceae bacterium]|nr:YdcF family protein [Pyrinomonadaceae bacterium]